MRWLISAGLLVLAIGFGTFAEPSWGGDGAAATPPAAAEVPSYTSVQTLPRSVTLATLSNGLTVIVQENHTAPVATVRCYVKNTGSAYEGRWLGAGLSHVLEHVVAGGSTARRTEKEITRLMDSFGGANNAFTTTDMTSFYIDCPAREIMTTIDLIADAMQHVKFEPNEFARELKVVRREMADNEVDRPHVLDEMINQTLYAVSPARHPIVGYIDVLNQTTNQTIIDFYHHRYVPQNQVFVVVGDVHTRAVLDQIARQWAGTQRAAETLVVLPDEPDQVSPRLAVREMEGTTFDLAFAWPSVKMSQKEMYALDVAAAVLAQGESSRMVRRLKYDRQLVLTVSSASYTPHFVRGWFGIIAAATPEHWQEASTEILRETYRLRDELVAPAELAKIKKQMVVEQLLQWQKVQNVAESLGRSFITTADPLFDWYYVDEIQKVTAEQVRDVAQRYLVPEHLNRAIIAPPGKAPKGDAATATPTEGETRLVRLPNGLRVLLKRQASVPLVNVQALVLGGVAADSLETAGRSAILAAMLDKGTAAHTAAQFAEYFDAIGGRFSVGSGRATVFAGLTVLRDDFPAALAQFAECVNQPGFPDAEFEKTRQLALEDIASRSDDPHAEIMEFFSDHLPAESLYHIVEGGKTDSVKRLTAADLRAYHAKYFVPNNMVLTVFGDIEPEAALELVTRHFGALRSDPTFVPPNFNRPNGLKETITAHKTIAKATGMVVFGYPETGLLERKDYAAMMLLNGITTGYDHPGGWLHEELRGAGLVYSVYGFQMTGLAPGYFTIVAQTPPDKVTEVAGRIAKDMQRAKAGKISEEEFQAARQMILALHAQENKTIAEQASQAAIDELFGFGYDDDRHFEERMQAVTAADVARVAAKYLGNHVLVTSSPAAEAGKP